MSEEGAGADGSVASLLATVERLRVREARLAALYATANDLTGIRDVEEILAAIVARARQLLGTDVSYLGLNDDTARAIDIRVTDGAVSASFRNLQMPFGTGLLGLVAGTGEPWVTPDYHADERFQHRDYIDDAVRDEQIRAILGVPMKVKGTTIGALLAANRTPRPFPTEEVELLSSFAAHAAIALENARLFSAAEDATQRSAAHSRAMERAARTHDRLTAALVGEGVVGDVAAVLADDLDARVEVLDADGRVLAALGGPSTPADAVDDAIEPPPSAVVADSVARGRSVPLDPGAGVHRDVAAAPAGGEHLGTVVVRRGRPVEDAERRTLDRAALGIAVLLSFERTVALADGRAREDLLVEVLDGSGDDGRLGTRLRREGVHVEQPHVLVVAAVEAAHREACRRRVETWARGERGLSAVLDGDVVVVVPGDDPRATGVRVQNVVAAVDVDACIGAVGVRDLRHGAPEALAAAATTARALVALGRRGEVADPASLGSVGLLLAAVDRPDAHGFVEHTIGPVLAWDAERGTALAETVEHWCAADGSAVRAAGTLHVHTNTVVQRLERVGVLLGADWRSPDRLLDVRLALRVWRLGTPRRP